MTFLTDLDDLIRHHHGDVKKLREIRNTIRHDNFITTVDKNYVETLIDTHLKGQPLDTSSSTHKSSAKIRLKTKQQLDSSDSQSNSSFSFSSNKRLGLLTGVAAAIAIIAIVGFTAINQTDTVNSTINSTTSNPLLINVDQATYKKADIISISGDTITNTKSVKLSIEDTAGEKIWNETINPKNNGEFSTLVIAGGGGWENGGTYTLKAEQNNLVSEIAFNFVA